MMATTQPEDIPQTIRSRCQHFSFHAVKFEDIVGQLKDIAKQEKITIEDDAVASNTINAVMKKSHFRDWANLNSTK